MGTSNKLPDVRRLRAADARSYRGVLVEALIVHPDCFAEDYNDEISRPLSETELQLERSGVFGAWLGATLVGIGGAVPCTTSKRQHCAIVRNLYVRHQFRRRGIGRLLLQEILHYAATDVQQLETQIPLGSEDVVRLFEQFGFRLCGLVPGRLKIDTEDIDVWTMIRQFS